MLLQQTKAVISEVERLSGRKVVVQEDPTLKTLANVQTARGAAPFHLVRYRASGDTVNYLIVYQLGFLMRLFSCPAGKRWEVAASAEEKGRGIQALGLSTLPPQLAPSLLDNLIIQLRTYSVGLRVDQWILREHPGLREEQRTSVQAQLSENEQALAPDIRDRFPKGLVDVNSSMNAAFAKFWANHLDEPRYMVPFASLGYEGVASQLHSVLEVVPNRPEMDRQLVESWAQVLGMTDYFHFISHTFDD